MSKRLIEEVIGNPEPPIPLKEYEGDMNMTLEDSQLRGFFERMKPTVVMIRNSSVKDDAPHEKKFGGVLVSPLGHILTIATLFEIDYVTCELKVFFHDDVRLQRPEVANIIHKGNNLVVLKLDSNRTDFPYAKLAESELGEGRDFHFINPVGGPVGNAYMRGNVSIPNRGFLEIKTGRMNKYEREQSRLLLAKKRRNFSLLELNDIYSTHHLSGTPLFNDKGNICGIYFFSGLLRSYGFPLMTLRDISHFWIIGSSSSSRRG